MARIYPVGEPENESEREAIAYLGKHLPGNYALFHNLELPTRAGLPYEYDAIVVGEYAVYTIEVKGYRGKIQGNAREWELNSGSIVSSPIPLANKKSKVVQERLSRHSPLLNSVWVQPIVVLSDDRVVVDLDDPQAGRVLHLAEAVAYLQNPRRLPFVDPPSIARLADLVRDAIGKQFRPLRRQQEIGDYRVLETIGRNDLYATFLAEHRLIRTKKRFTLKVYSFEVYATPDERQKQQEWVLRDANALHRLAGHPNIVQAYPPFPWQDNRIVLPLEWVDGYSLRSLLDGHVKTDFAGKVQIARQLCRGLQHAHINGVIHRDVRPENIIVSKRGRVKLVNFDCARVVGADLQTIATRVGRQLDERYVAPEVWQNAGAASPASDQVAVGLVIFELFAGRPCFEKIRDFFAAKGLPGLPTEVNPSLPKQIDSIMARMCAFAPDDRYASLELVAEELKAISA